MDKLYSSSFSTNDPVDKILKRQSERKKTEEKINLGLNIYGEIEKFTEDFVSRQAEIERKFKLIEAVEHEKLHQHFAELNEDIQCLQKFYSNATIFLRIYDKKVCQSALHGLQVKLKDLENRLLPKKKFGFKNKTNRMRSPEGRNGLLKKANAGAVKSPKYLTGKVCGFSERNNEILFLGEEEVEKMDVVLSDMDNCSVKIYGNPSTMHVTNLRNCQIYSGPVTTSVFVENVQGSCLHLACQQLRIHETKNTEFYVHVTSKAIIEDSKDVRFGVYKLEYDGIDKHYRGSGLNVEVNNWDKVDDFNWLAADQPSPNWSKLSN